MSRRFVRHVPAVLYAADAVAVPYGDRAAGYSQAALRAPENLLTASGAALFSATLAW